VKLPKPKEGDSSPEVDAEQKTHKLPLPQTLVRIPTEHAPMLQQSSPGGVVGGNEG
jgi:DASH complex subunit DAD2